MTDPIQRFTWQTYTGDRHTELVLAADAEAHEAAAVAEARAEERNADTPIRGDHHPLCFPAIRDVRSGDWGPSCFTCQVIGMAVEQGQRDERAALDACQSVDDAVALLKTVGLDITYTDDGLRVIARQIVRMGQRDAEARIRAGVEGLDKWHEEFYSTVVYDSVLAVIDAAPQEYVCNNPEHRACTGCDVVRAAAPQDGA